MLPSNTAFGVLDYKFGTHSNFAVPNNSGPSTSIITFNPITLHAGRIYKIHAQLRATSPGCYVALYMDGSIAGIDGTHDVYGAKDSGASFGSIDWDFTLMGSHYAGTHTFEIRVNSDTTSTGTIYDDGCVYTISDAGPEFGPLTVVPAPAITVPSGWQTPTLLNSWVNYGPGALSLRYRLNGDRVEIEGTIKGGTPDSVAFNLPIGFRPTSGLVGFINAGGTLASNYVYRTDIGTDGSVTVRNHTGSGLVNFINFTNSFAVS
jgi:hypothetical protein